MNSIDLILEDAVSGKRISVDDALVLFDSSRLIDIGIAADALCKTKHPEGYRTYVVDRNINYTNVCVSRCKFCAFYREPDSPDAYLLSDIEIHTKIQEAVDLGATQILMQGGLHPDLTIEYYVSLVKGIKERFNVDLHSFSPPEIIHIAGVSGTSVEETIRALKEAGLDSIPGGGAEILTDSVRTAISPNKCSTSQWLGVMESAHNLGMRTTATMMFGHAEGHSDRVAHMAGIRELQDKTGGFTAFIPWTFQPANTELGGKPVAGFDYLRTLAISRLFLDNVPNIQASWVTQGDKIGQVALHFGANDLGSTMIEENVVAATGVKFSMTEQEMRLAITDAGFTPKKRDTYYNLQE